MHPHRRDVLRAHRVSHIRARPPRIPEPAPRPHLHPARGRVALPAPRHGEDTRHPAGHCRGAASAIQQEDGQQWRGQGQAGIELELRELKSVLDAAVHALLSVGMMSSRRFSGPYGESYHIKIVSRLQHLATNIRSSF